MATDDPTTKTPKTAKNNSGPQVPPPATTAPAPAPAAPPTTALTPPPETQALEVFDYGDDAGQGFENQDMSDRKLPIIELLQSNSPQLVVGLVESFEIYGILYDGKTGEMAGFAMIPFTSTKIKVYRAWNSAIGNFAPTIGGKKLNPGQVPIFAHRVRMTSESETKGTNTYMVPVLAPAEGGDDLKSSLLPKTDPRYIAAKKLHDDVLAGHAKAAYETTQQEAGVDPESDAPF